MWWLSNVIKQHKVGKIKYSKTNRTSWQLAKEMAIRRQWIILRFLQALSCGTQRVSSAYERRSRSQIFTTQDCNALSSSGLCLFSFFLSRKNRFLASPRDQFSHYYCTVGFERHTQRQQPASLCGHGRWSIFWSQCCDWWLFDGRRSTHQHFHCQQSTTTRCEPRETKSAWISHPEVCWLCGEISPELWSRYFSRNGWRMGAYGHQKNKTLRCREYIL